MSRVRPRTPRSCLFVLSPVPVARRQRSARCSRKPHCRTGDSARMSESVWVRARIPAVAPPWGASRARDVWPCLPLGAAPPRGRGRTTRPASTKLYGTRLAAGPLALQMV